ncbi:hypothetical protein BDW02DRAFT_592243 [Decorospora gaudefroyi]|uniref:Uncharacterized protein n=1 Tax=Decorospora gaudefroyi TaxID=184978 RepID=A0A6A5K674_9PLEO|nr:hypothetical protein BDW02DRAFT_592243 [Decorospora gaudefroyi]
MAPQLWIMATMSSANINPLHRQRIKGREIIVTEDPRLHLVWIHDRIFIKPIPRCLLSHTFWETYLDRKPESLGDGQSNLRAQDHLRLIPKDIDWASFCRFTSDLNHIADSAVSQSYCFGELRLTRLNLYAPLLLCKFHFEQVALAADELMAVRWVSVWHGCRWLSLLSLIGTVVVAVWFVALWLWMFLDEWVYTARRKLEKRSNKRDGSKC